MKMKNLVLKIKSYQEDTTYLTLNIPNYLDNTQIIEIGRAAKVLVDGMVGKCIHTPNIIRFENADGVFNFQLNQIISYS